jgi:hypothetical protein
MPRPDHRPGSSVWSRLSRGWHRPGAEALHPTAWYAPPWRQAKAARADRLRPKSDYFEAAFGLRSLASANPFLAGERQTVDASGRKGGLKQGSAADVSDSAIKSKRTRFSAHTSQSAFGFRQYPLLTSQDQRRHRHYDQYRCEAKKN